MTRSTEILQLLAEADAEVSLAEAGAAGIPDPWRAVLVSKDARRLALDLWAARAGCLPRFLAAQRGMLQGVLLVRFHGLFQIAYDYGGERVFVGGLPFGEKASLGLLENAPPSLRRFYRELHDGYVLPSARSLGSLPRRYLFTLNQVESGWLEDTDDPNQYDPLDEKIVVFSNGGSGYLCFDSARSAVDNAAGMVWWKDEPPDRGPLLATLDAWMEIGLTV